MKKHSLILLAAATLIGGLTVSCVEKNIFAPKPGSHTTNATTPTASLNIRYIDADSISSQYKLAQEYQELTLATVSRIERETQNRQAAIQRKASEIERKARSNGYLTQESYESDMNALSQMQQQAENVIAQMQRQAQAEMAQRQQAMNDSLENFIRDFNARYGYDAILYKAAGVYFSPALDITDEVVAGLNERYKGSASAN